MTNKKRGKRTTPFARIYKDLIDSPAFQSLSNSARVTYLLLRAQINHDKQVKVIFPYIHAQKYMKSNTFSRAITQLTTHGFIKKEQKGGLYRKTNVYTFVDEWRSFKP